MKKTLLSIFALFTFTLCNAQVKTQSNYDVDGNGKVTIEDVTSTVNKVIGLPVIDRTLVDAVSLNALLSRLERKLDELQKEHELIMREMGMTITKGHDYVDLGLPSGLKWATCNVGANSPEEYGDYFAWGETEPYYKAGHSQDAVCLNWISGKSGYNWPSYKWCNGSSTSQTKYCTDSSWGTVDNKRVLDLEDDAAHVNWGGDWRMPTNEEQIELHDKCTWIWGLRNGVNGFTVVGPNGNSLFLPAAGQRELGKLNSAADLGRYWSSSLNCLDGDRAYSLIFDAGTARDYPEYDYFIFDEYPIQRYTGFPVRPVCK